VGGSGRRWLAFSGGVCYVVLPLPFYFSFGFLDVFSLFFGFFFICLAQSFFVHVLNVPIRCCTRRRLTVVGKAISSISTNQN